MKQRKTIEQNLDSGIISFFKNVSTIPIDSDIYHIESIYNNGFKIYKSNNYYKKRQTLAVLLLKDEVQNIDQLDYVIDIIDEWLSSCLSTNKFFIINEIKNNLFDNRAIKNVRKFCNQFEDELKKIIENNVKKRFLIFPVMNFFKSSISFNKVGYISKNENIIPIIREHFSEGAEYVYAKLIFEMNNPIFNDADGFIFVRTHLGENFKSKSEEYVKLFVMVCLSTIKESPSSISCCLIDQFTKCVYFDDFNVHHYREFRNPILPSIAKNQINSFDFEEVQKWFDTFKDLESDKKERIERCIYLVNNAFCNKKYKKFGELCQGIDALFGINRKVEKTVNGNLRNIIKQYNGDHQFLEKIDKLWDLRNNLVHGSVKNIRDSDVYLEYQLKYLNCAEDDYLDLSLFCIKHSVDYFNSGHYQEFKSDIDNNNVYTNTVVHSSSKFKSFLKTKFQNMNNWIQSL